MRMYLFPNLLLFIILFNMEIKYVLMDFYSSILTLTNLSKEEVRLVNGLKRYMEAEEKEGNEADEYLVRFLQTVEDEVIDSKVPENPIDAFHLLKRWVEDWEKCFERVFCSDCEVDGPAIDFNLTRGIVEKRLNGWPNQMDVDAAITAIFRLWYMYDFHLNELLHGRIYKFDTKPFKLEDILYISNKAEDRKDMYTAIKFLEALLEEMKDGNYPDSSIGTVRIARATAGAYNRNDMPWKSVKILQEYLDKEPGNKRLKADFDYFKMKASSIPESDRTAKLEKPDKDTFLMPSDTEYEAEVVKNYKALCKGSIKTHKEQSRLYCYYKKTVIPLYNVKTEVTNKKPWVVLFHDVISEDEMNYIKNESMPKLKRSIVVQDHAQSIMGPAQSRISRSAWLSDLDHTLLQKLSRRIKLITGLETEFKHRFSNTEEYQVLNYGIGGMYQPHLDPLFIPATDRNQGINPHELKGSGDRIATFMLYLSDVMYGGATVFPKLKARIPVIKGGAAFWYNLHLNGTVNENMLHAGCPVLVGSKWVTNKWIREIGQTFRRPCGLKRKAIYKGDFGDTFS